MERGGLIGSLRGHSSAVLGCTFSTDGSRILSASEDEPLKLWGGQSGEELRTLEGHTDAVSDCTFRAPGSSPPAAMGTLKLWDGQSGEELLALEGHAGAVSSCACSHDRFRILSAP
jgi:WD40 repeat protein